ncbi:hypothetical protein ACI01nite_18760 [Acetobacter cibinongensis]|uniref:DUF262 domain-containing protein n=2 Tax=Acetobacter cibinongensis TaxID=146475 RepID=A0A0D6N190_9PROT|nr:hypothetical protein Abci_007_155 [Acetobacter cibinongensis]GEL59274.1 hypothetical protein ACI01nite_18760 [Acetobacter cibinongensis]
MFTEKLFRIPDYQRGYAWTKLQLDDFWSDLNQIEKTGNHYTGVLTLETVSPEIYNTWPDDEWIINSKNFFPYYVVDGQQRLTTCIILIQCISERLTSDSESLNYTTKLEIQKKFIFDSKDSGISRSYIFGYEKDNPSYNFLKANIFCEPSPSDRSEITAYTNNLLCAKNYFSDCIKNFDKIQLNDLYQRVTQKLLFNIFTISDDVDVCVAFETMNNRGKPLSYLELLKNRLIFISTKIESDKTEIKGLRTVINECWKTIYHYLGKNKNRPLDDDFFLRAHYFLHFITPAPEAYSTPEDYRKGRAVVRALSAQTYKGLLSEIFTLKSILAEREENKNADDEYMQKIHKYSMSLQENVKIWYEIFNPHENNDENSYHFWLTKLNRLNIDTIYPIILSVMLSTKDHNERTRAFKEIERNIFLSMMSTGYYARADSVCFDMLNFALLLKNKNININEFIEKIKNDTIFKYNDNDGSKRIKEYLRNKNYYSWKLIHYLFFEYNLEIQLHSKTDRKKIDWNLFIENADDYESIEHIYPQKAQNKYWREKFKGLKSGQREALKNVIGNLLPLSKPKNSSLSNLSYPEKVKSSTDGVGYIYGSYAENEISAKYSDWTPQAVLDRSLHLLDFIEKRWGISFGKDAEKIDMLGLSFVQPNTRLHQKRYYYTDVSTSQNKTKGKDIKKI